MNEREEELAFVKRAEQFMESGGVLCRNEIYKIIRVYLNEYARNQEIYDEPQAR